MSSAIDWPRVKRTGRAVFDMQLLPNVDEQAGPAYFKGWILSRWLFWQRLRWLEHYLNYTGPRLPVTKECAIDFGCGFGLALPLLQQRFQSSYAIDLYPELAETFMEHWQVTDSASNHRVTFSRSIESAAIADESADLIVAFDVLEHFESLDEILQTLRRVLRPGGRLIVSGPTENWAYRLGRRCVGFSGDYHQLDVYQVMAAMSKQFDVRVEKLLPTMLPLFLMISAS